MHGIIPPPSLWKLKPIKGFRFPRKGDPSFETIPMKPGGGQVSISSSQPCIACNASAAPLWCGLQIEQGVTPPAYDCITGDRPCLATCGYDANVISGTWRRRAARRYWALAGESQ